MIENHQDRAFDTLISWTTNLKSIGLGGGVGTMPLERSKRFEVQIDGSTTNLHKMAIWSVQILVQFDD